MTRVPAVLLAAMAFSAGCAASTYPLNPQLAAQVGVAEPSFQERAGQPQLAFRQQGSCSWYGPGFHGRRTSNGERFNKHEMTAAHPTLPFGSRVEVTDRDSGKKVTVRINDRGPYARGRILDLSYAAAASLDIVDKGVANVQLRLVDIDEASIPERVWAVEVATFSQKTEANRFIEGLSSQQRSAGLYYVKEENGGFRVRFGPFLCESSAKNAAGKLQRVGLKPSLMREELTRADESPVGGPIVR